MASRTANQQQCQQYRSGRLRNRQDFERSDGDRYEIIRRVVEEVDQVLGRNSFVAKCCLRAIRFDSPLLPPGQTNLITADSKFEMKVLVDRIDVHSNEIANNLYRVSQNASNCQRAIGPHASPQAVVSGAVGADTSTDTKEP